MLSATYQMDHIWFCDDIFGLKPGWIETFAQLIEQNKLKIRYKVQSRADILLKGEMIKNLAASGCQVIWMGVESGSQTILDAMDKGITMGQVAEATEKIKKAGMKPAFFLQLGYIGETRHDISATLSMLRALMPDDIGVSVSYPLPGTKFYEKVKHELSHKRNWTDSDDLAMMFHNVYEQNFYRRLHTFVHKKFRKRQASEAIMQLITGRKPDRQMIYKAASMAYYLPAEILAFVQLKRSGW